MIDLMEQILSHPLVKMDNNIKYLKIEPYEFQVIREKTYILFLNNLKKQNPSIKLVEIFTNYDDANKFLKLTKLNKIKTKIIYTDKKKKFNKDFIFANSIEEGNIIKKILKKEGYLSLNIESNSIIEKIYEEKVAPLLNNYFNGNIDYIFVYIKTGELAMGLAEYFKFFNPNLKIIGVRFKEENVKIKNIRDYNIDKMYIKSFKDISKNDKSIDSCNEIEKEIYISKLLDYVFNEYIKEYHISKKNVLLI